MQSFSLEHLENFKKYFHIKDVPSISDTAFIEKTKKYIKFIQWIPGLQMIGIGNSIAMNASTPESDIDLFIVTSKKRMWLVRILTTSIFGILGVRKTHKHHAGRFCLSFFCTTSGMDFSAFALENDIYLYFRIMYFQPILSFNHTYENFISAQKWAVFSLYQKEIHAHTQNICYKGTTYGENSKILDFFDGCCQKIFLPKTLHHYEKLGKPYGIIIHDDMLKFHNNDIRIELKKELLP